MEDWQVKNTALPLRELIAKQVPQRQPEVTAPAVNRNYIIPLTNDRRAILIVPAEATEEDLKFIQSKISELCSHK